MQVQSIMTKDPACCTPETGLPTVSRLMFENKCGAVPVVTDLNSRSLIGIVSSRDIICRVLANGENPCEKAAKDCMTSPVVTIAPDASLDDCCRKMEHCRIRRILVVDASGACCGIVSLDDIAYWEPNKTTAALIRAVMQVPKSASIYSDIP